MSDPEGSVGTAAWPPPPQEARLQPQLEQAGRSGLRRAVWRRREARDGAQLASWTGLETAASGKHHRRPPIRAQAPNKALASQAVGRGLQPIWALIAAPAFVRRAGASCVRHSQGHTALSALPGGRRTGRAQSIARAGGKLEMILSGFKFYSAPKPGR